MKTTQRCIWEQNYVCHTISYSKHQTPSSYLVCFCLLFLGEAGLSQAQQEAFVSRLIPGLSEAVYISGADKGAGTPETPQRPLSHQNSGQQ